MDDLPLLRVNSPEQTFRKREKWCRCLSGLQCIILAVVITIVIVVAIVLGVLFGAGKKLAETAIDDSDIKFSTMHMYNPTDDGFMVRINGAIDNRNVLAATLEATTISLGSGDTIGKQLFGTMQFPSQDLQGGASNPFTLDVKVTITDQDNFNIFATSLMTSETVTLNLQATVTVKAAGLKYSSIPLKKAIVLTGYDSFDGSVFVLSQSIYEGTPTQLLSNLNVTMNNPSMVSFGNLGDVSLNVKLDGVTVGTASTTNFQLVPGDNQAEWQVTLTKTQDNQDAIDAIMSAYARGDTIQLEMYGSNTSTSVKILQAAFSSLVIQTGLPGLVHAEDKLVNVVYTSMSIATATTNSSDCYYANEPAIQGAYVDVFLFVHNPFDANITLHDIDFNVWWDRHDQLVVGRQFLAHARVRDADFSVPPQGIRVQTQRLCLRADMSSWVFQPTGIVNYVSTYHHDDLDGVKPWTLKTYVNGTIHGTVGDFVAPLTYEQKFVTVTRFTEA